MSGLSLSRGNNMYTHIEPVVVSRNTRKADEMQNRSSDTDLQFVTASDWLEAALRNEGPGGGARPTMTSGRTSRCCPQSVTTRTDARAVCKIRLY